MSNRPTVFISYSHQDEDEKEALLTHLRVSAKDGLIDVWSDDQIGAGVTWQREVEAAMARADVAVLLISANYLASGFIVDEQIPRLLQRRQDEGLTIFPVIAKACAWQATSWLKQMDIRPKHGQAIWREGGRYAYEDLAAIVGEIERILRRKKGDERLDKDIGIFLGRYQLLNLLGQGSSMARVYETFHPGLNMRMAIKVMDSRRMSDSVLERFQDEAMMVVKLRHNHIVQVYDFDQAKGKHYMVMDLIEGPTLEAKLKARQSQPFTLAEIIELIGTLAGALDYAHNQGVVHHDLKPANIMFTTASPEGRLVLTDFGIARIMGAANQTIPSMFLGTPHYTSPEQAQGRRGDRRSDIYALGVILYELATGRLPFEADTAAAVMGQHLNMPAPPPTGVNPELPKAVEQVILKALHKNPAERYQTAGALAEALKVAMTTPAVSLKGLPSVSTPQLIRAYAVAQIHGKPTILHINKKYLLRAGITEEALEGFSERSVILPDRDAIQIDITVAAEDMDIEPGLLQTFIFRRSRPGTLLEFHLTPKETGHKQIRVEFYYEQHWLAQIKFEVEVVEAEEPVLT